MRYHNDELHIGQRCFDVVAELSGADWEHADPSVGIMHGGYAGVTVDELTVIERNDEGEPIHEVTDPETLNAIRERVAEDAAEDDRILLKLTEAEEDRRYEERMSRNEPEY